MFRMSSNIIQLKAGMTLSLQFIWNTTKNTNIECEKLSYRTKFHLHAALLWLRAMATIKLPSRSFRGFKDA